MISEEEKLENHIYISEFDSGDFERCQYLSHFLENNLVTNLIINTKVNNSPLEW